MSREADDKHNEATQARHQTILLVRTREATMRNQETNWEIWKLGVKEGVGIVGVQLSKYDKPHRQTIWTSHCGTRNQE